MADKMSLKRLLGLFSIAAKMDLMWLLRDTRFAVLGILGDTVNNLATLSGVFLIASRFGGVGGMSADEVLFMMAYSTLVTGLFLLFGSGNNVHVSRIIGRGQLEHMFIQPLSLPAQLLTCGFCPFTSSGTLVVGVVLMGIAIQRLALSVSVLWLLALVGYLLVTVATIVGQAYLVSTLAFYAPVAAEEISSTAIDETWLVSTFPLSGMPSYIQILLLTIMPEGLMAWFPALCLLGKPPLGLTAYYPILFAILLALLARFVFKKGLNYYVKAGSNRYVPWGFRR